MTLQKTTSLALLSASLLTLAGCASGPKAPVYDPAAAPETQAAAFITATAAKNAAKVDRVAVTSCNVMFAATSSASASTGGGLFDNSNRSEASVSVIYTLSGLTDQQLQQLADQICVASEQQLATSGYQLVPRSELVANDTYKKLQEAGRASPYDYKVGASEYKLFARTGDSVFDERYIGTASGLGQAFRAAAGGAAWQHEAVVLEELNASGVNLNIMVDFASVESSGKGPMGGIVSRNTAEVSGSVQLGVSGELALKPFDRLDCWNRFGKRECFIKPNHIARFSNGWPIILSDSFYSEVADTTTAGDKAMAGATVALSLLIGSDRRSVTRYEVRALPDRYVALSSQGSQAFVGMALTQAQAAKK